jgi:hypothetical protein
MIKNTILKIQLNITTQQFHLQSVNYFLQYCLLPDIKFRINLECVDIGQKNKRAKYK